MRIEKRLVKKVATILFGYSLFTIIPAPVFSADITWQGINIPDQSGQAITVLGPVDPGSLGHTLMHEHFFNDFWLPLDQPKRWAMLGMKPPSSKEEITLWNEKVTAANRARLIPSFWRNRDAFSFHSIDDALDELSRYKALGGQTFVDVTTIGLNRNPKKLKKVASKSGVNIVMGTGFYRRAWHPADMDQRSLDDLTSLMVREIVTGVDNTGIKAGIIGEIPAEDLVFKPKESNELRVLRAAARTSQLTGAAISVHSHFSDMQKLHLALDLLTQEGTDLSRVVLGHITNVAVQDINFLESLLRRGVYLQFDVLGNPWQTNFPDRPTMEAIKKLITNGFASQLLVSHDFGTKLQMSKFGGYGLTFVHSMLFPYLRNNGVSERVINEIIVNNPRRVLTFVEPRSLRLSADANEV